MFELFRSLRKQKDERQRSSTFKRTAKIRTKKNIDIDIDQQYLEGGLALSGLEQEEKRPGNETGLAIRREDQPLEDGPLNLNHNHNLELSANSNINYQYPNSSLRYSASNSYKDSYRDYPSVNSGQVSSLGSSTKVGRGGESREGDVHVDVDVFGKRRRRSYFSKGRQSNQSSFINRPVTGLRFMSGNSKANSSSSIHHNHRNHDNDEEEEEYNSQNEDTPSNVLSSMVNSHIHESLSHTQSNSKSKNNSKRSIHNENGQPAPTTGRRRRIRKNSHNMQNNPKHKKINQNGKPNPNNEEMNLPFIQSKQRSREAMIQASLFVGGFLICYIWVYIIGIYEAIGIESPYFIRICLWTFFPLQGFLNVFIYTRPHVARLVRYNKNISWRRALFEVIMSGGDVSRRRLKFITKKVKSMKRRTELKGYNNGAGLGLGVGVDGRQPKKIGDAEMEEYSSFSPPGVLRSQQGSMISSLENDVSEYFDDNAMSVNVDSVKDNDDINNINGNGNSLGVNGNGNVNVIVKDVMYGDVDCDIYGDEAISMINDDELNDILNDLDGMSFDENDEDQDD